MSIEKLKANYPVKIQWVHFPCIQTRQPKGRRWLRCSRVETLSQYARGSKVSWRKLGFAYGERTHTYNSRLAQELGAWADTQAGGDAIHDALYRAYFVDAVNISDRDALIAIAEAVGLDGDAARTVLTERSFSAKVDDDYAIARSWCDGRADVLCQRSCCRGCQPYETLEKFVKHLLAQNNTRHGSETPSLRDR